MKNAENSHAANTIIKKTDMKKIKIMKKIILTFLLTITVIIGFAQETKESDTWTLYTSNSVFYYPSTQSSLYSPGFDHEIGYTRSVKPWWNVGPTAEVYYWTTTENGANRNDKVFFLNINSVFTTTIGQVSPYVGLTVAGATNTIKLAGEGAAYTGINFTTSDNSALFVQVRYGHYTQTLSQYNGYYYSIGLSINIK